MKSMPVRGRASIKTRLMLVMGYLGAVIGAGFASGQEIVQFFVSYGDGGFKGCILSTVLFALSGGLLLYLAHNNRVSNYQDLLACLMGEKTGRTLDFMLAIFLFLGISTMLSASGAVFHEHLYLPKEWGILLAYLFILVSILTGRKGLFYTYNILVPLKMVLLLIIAGYAAFGPGVNSDETYAAFSLPAEPNYWIVAALLYVAYNFSLAMVVLTEYQAISTRKDSMVGAAWGGVVLGVLIILNYFALTKFLPIILHYEVPMLYIAGHISSVTKIVYTAVLWVGILTTAIANAYGFAQRFASFAGISYGLCLFLCLTLALPVSLQSFSVLVGKVYPLFGILGVIILGTLLFKATKDISLEIYYNIKNAR